MTLDEYTDKMHDASKERTRSRSEIHARYLKALDQYRQLLKSNENVKEQKLLVFNEIKLLGWVLGKRDKDVAKELNQP
jgi:hypothetical protein